MADKRIIVINRTIDTLSQELVAKINIGEWFYVKDRQCIYWINPTSGKPESISNPVTIQNNDIGWVPPATYNVNTGINGSAALLDGQTKIGFLTPSDSTGGNKLNINGTSYKLLNNVGAEVLEGEIPPNMYIEAIYVESKGGFQVVSDLSSTNFTDGIRVGGEALFENIVVSGNLQFTTATGKIVDMGAHGIINPNLGSIFKKTITANTSLQISAASMDHIEDGYSASFILELANGGSRVVTWPNNVVWDGDIPPVLSTTGITSIGFYSIGKNTKWRGILLISEIPLDPA